MESPTLRCRRASHAAAGIHARHKTPHPGLESRLQAAQACASNSA
jgi:hypothetical protein